MKKQLVILMLGLTLLTGCSRSEVTGASPSQQNTTPAGEIIEIKEKMFISQTNDIYLNAQDYLGKTIRYEGIYKTYSWEGESTVYQYVIRYGPGCCGNDGEAGFQVIWEGEHPAEDDWVEAVGVLEEHEDEDGWRFLWLKLTSLTVLEKRGAEFVEQ